MGEPGFEPTELDFRVYTRNSYVPHAPFTYQLSHIYRGGQKMAPLTAPHLDCFWWWGSLIEQKVHMTRTWKTRATALALLLHPVVLYLNSLPPVLTNFLHLENRGKNMYLRIVVRIKCLCRPIANPRVSSRVWLDTGRDEFGFYCSWTDLDTLPAGWLAARWQVLRSCEAPSAVWPCAAGLQHATVVHFRNSQCQLPRVSSSSVHNPHRRQFPHY